MAIKKTLAEYAPELAAQWHPTKNGDITPDKITPKNSYRAWWLGPCGHEWKTSISNRTNGKGCPVCAGHKVLSGYNDLPTKNPELASQFHPTKNGNLTAEQLTIKSNKIVWWLCPNCGNEYQKSVAARTNGAKCSACSKTRTEKIIERRGSLLDNNPKLAAQWHPTKNGELTPNHVTTKSSIEVWWLCPNCGNEYQKSVAARTNGAGCSACTKSRTEKIIELRGSLLDNNPKLAAQWHPTKNSELTPNRVATKSNIKVWWLCPDCGHEWEAKISSRSTGAGCPICGREKKRKARTN